jgi:hypothetical protein
MEIGQYIRAVKQLYDSILLEAALELKLSEDEAASMYLSNVENHKEIITYYYTKEKSLKDKIVGWFK